MSPNMLPGKQRDCVQKGYQAVKSELVCLTEQRKQVEQKPDGFRCSNAKSLCQPKRETWSHSGLATISP